MHWTFARAGEAFSEARRGWDEINAAHGNHILLDSEFVECALRHFGDGRVLLGEKCGSEHPGMALVVRSGVGRWDTYQPSQTPLGLILLPQSCDVPRELLSLIKSLPGYALQFSALHQDPDYAMVPVSCDSQMFEQIDYIETPRVRLSGTFEQYWKGRSVKLRQNVGRRRRRMLDKGYEPELVVVVQPDQVAEAVREHARMESKSWKELGGTAVKVGGAQAAFYQDVFERFCARGEAVIFQLRAGGTVWASDLCLVRGSMLILLKTTYDEDWGEYSPATLMREEIMKYLYGQGRVRDLEFYGPTADWHRQWTNDVRRMYHVTCFRHRWFRSLRALVKRTRPRG